MTLKFVKSLRVLFCKKVLQVLKPLINLSKNNSKVFSVIRDELYLLLSESPLTLKTEWTVLDCSKLMQYCFWPSEKKPIISPS